MASSLGLYFGNSTVTIALHRDGKNEVITNDSGDRLTPAVVAINETEFITGMAAKVGLTRNAAGSVVNNKRLLNVDISEEELELAISSSPYTITSKNQEIIYTLTQGERSISTTAEDIAIHLFKKMFSIASNAVRSETNLKVVISVPIHFSQASRLRVRNCAENAGFDVVQIFNEPSAAVLAYGIGEADVSEACNVLVYRLGGVSCDASIVQVCNGMYSILSTVHKSNLGGSHFTKLLADYIAKEFMNKWKLDPQESKRSMSKLRQHADTCKHVLSTMSASQVFIESLCDGVDWRQNITRPRFESLISPVMQKYIEPINDCLAEAAVSIHKVILCGGSTRIPKVQATIAALFPDAELLSDRADEIIAEGCAKQASFLAHAWDPECEHVNIEVPFLNKNVLICDAKQEVKVQIPTATPLPTKVKFTECLPKEQDKYELTIYEDDIKAEKILGTASFPNAHGVIMDFEVYVTKENIQISIVEAN